MKKSKVLSTPTRLTDLSFDDLNEQDFDSSLKLERINNRQRRLFRNETA